MWLLSEDQVGAKSLLGDVVKGWSSLPSGFTSQTSDDRKTPRPCHTYELRAATPVPNRLTLSGHVLRPAHAAVLSGRLTGNGAARGHTAVAIVARVRRVTPTGTLVDDHIVARTTTSASAMYRVRVALKETTTFSAVARLTVSRCHGAAIAPGGCVSTTSPPAESEPLVLTP
jgi:hypothetical protein